MRVVATSHFAASNTFICIWHLKVFKNIWKFWEMKFGCIWHLTKNNKSLQQSYCEEYRNYIGLGLYRSESTLWKSSGNITHNTANLDSIAVSIFEVISNVRCSIPHPIRRSIHPSIPLIAPRCYIRLWRVILVQFHKYWDEQACLEANLQMYNLNAINNNYSISIWHVLDLQKTFFCGLAISAFFLSWLPCSLFVANWRCWKS